MSCPDGRYPDPKFAVDKLLSLDKVDLNTTKGLIKAEDFVMKKTHHSKHKKGGSSTPSAAATGTEEGRNATKVVHKTEHVEHMSAEEHIVKQNGVSKGTGKFQHDLKETVDDQMVANNHIAREYALANGKSTLLSGRMIEAPAGMTGDLKSLTPPEDGGDASPAAAEHLPSIIARHANADSPIVCGMVDVGHMGLGSGENANSNGTSPSRKVKKTIVVEEAVVTKRRSSRRGKEGNDASGDEGENDDMSVIPKGLGVEELSKKICESLDRDVKDVATLNVESAINNSHHCNTNSVTSLHRNSKSYVTSSKVTTVKTTIKKVSAQGEVVDSRVESYVEQHEERKETLGVEGGMDGKQMLAIQGKEKDEEKRSNRKEVKCTSVCEKASSTSTSVSHQSSQNSKKDALMICDEHAIDDTKTKTKERDMMEQSEEVSKKSAKVNKTSKELREECVSEDVSSSNTAADGEVTSVDASKARKDVVEECSTTSAMKEVSQFDEEAVEDVSKTSMTTVEAVEGVTIESVTIKNKKNVNTEECSESAITTSVSKTATETTNVETETAVDNEKTTKTDASKSVLSDAVQLEGDKKHHHHHHKSAKDVATHAPEKPEKVVKPPKAPGQDCSLQSGTGMLVFNEPVVVEEAQPKKHKKIAKRDIPSASASESSSDVGTHSSAKKSQKDAPKKSEPGKLHGMVCGDGALDFGVTVKQTTSKAHPHSKKSSDSNSKKSGDSPSKKSSDAKHASSKDEAVKADKHKKQQEVSDAAGMQSGDGMLRF